MLCHQITEDAHGDVAAFQIAEGIMSQLIRYLMAASPDDHYGFKGYRFKDGTMLALRGADIGLTGEDASLWFRFAKQTGYYPDGHISKFQKSGEKVITVNCMTSDELDPEQVRHSVIHSHVLHDVLIHELTHLNDTKRHATFYDTGSDKDHGPAYHNSPKEFNAYFTNLAAPLLRFLRMSREENAPMQSIAQRMGISTDFKANYAMLLNHASQRANGGVLRGFLADLDQRNRRALLKRLYALHQQVVQVLATNVNERAYHGTPHKFDRFSLDHVGTGEGAQAYGYGLYFAGKKEVAEFYRDAIGYTNAVANKTWTSPKGMPKKIGEQIVAILSQFFGQSDPGYIMKTVRDDARQLPDAEQYRVRMRDVVQHYEKTFNDRSKSNQLSDESRAAWQRRIADAKEELARTEREVKRAKILVKVLPYLEQYGVRAFVASGHVYHVDIPEENQFLLWDAKLNQQTPEVSAAIAKIDHPVINAWRTNGAWDHVNGKTLYDTLSGGMTWGNRAGQKAASEYLHSLGVAGIKYLDAGSRMETKGTYNYVVFDDSQIAMNDRE